MSKPNELFRDKVSEHDQFIEEENTDRLLAQDPAYQQWAENLDNMEREDGFDETKRTIPGR